jgi:hypothetical protein
MLASNPCVSMCYKSTIYRKIKALKVFVKKKKLLKVRTNLPKRETNQNIFFYKNLMHAPIQVSLSDSSFSQLAPIHVCLRFQLSTS